MKRKGSKHVRRTIAVCAALLAAAALTAPHLGHAQGGPAWISFHGDSTRSGVSTGSGPPSGTATNAWNIGSGTESSPVVDGAGNGYIASDNGKVMAFSTANAVDAKWTFSTGASAAALTLSPDGQRLYVSAANGMVYALNASNGSKLWSVSSDASAYAPAINSAGTILYVSDGAALLALNTSDGSTAWHSSLNGQVQGSPAMSPDGTTVYVATNNAAVYGFPAGNGTGGTIYYLDGPAVTGPATDANGNIYAATTFGTLFSFNPGTSAVRWTFVTGNHAAITTTPALAGGLAIFGATNGNVYAVNLSSGQQQWMYTTGGAVESSPVVATGNSTAYALSDDGYVYALGTGGNLVWKKFLNTYGPSSPAIGPDSSLWFANRGALLYRLHEISPPATLPVPTRGPAQTATPGPTSGPSPTAAPTNTQTVSLVIASVKGSVKPGSKQSVKVTYLPHTRVHFVVSYPNGDTQTHNATTGSNGAATYSYTQGASKITHSNRTATITVSAGSAQSATQYTIGFGRIDVSVEPRTGSRSSNVSIWVHTSKNTSVDLTVKYKNGTKTTGTKTGSSGWADKVYTVWSKAKVGKATVTARQHSHHKVSTSTSFNVT